MAEEVPKKELFWFLIVAFGVSWPLFLLPLAFGPPDSRARQMVTLVAWTAAMWGPGPSSSPASWPDEAWAR